MDELERQLCSGRRAGRRGAGVVFIALRSFREGLGMELAGEIFDGGGDARSGAIDGVADDREAAVLDGVEDTPARKAGERVVGMRRAVGMRFGEDEEFGLEKNHFFEIDLRPGLRGVDDGDGARVLQSVADEGVLSYGDEGFV